jgi:hypothetical protein
LTFILLLINMYVLIVIGVVMVAVATFDPDVSLDVPLLTRIMNSNSGSWQAIFFVRRLSWCGWSQRFHMSI